MPNANKIPLQIIKEWDKFKILYTRCKDRGINIKAMDTAILRIDATIDMCNDDKHDVKGLIADVCDDVKLYALIMHMVVNEILPATGIRVDSDIKEKANDTRKLAI